MVVQPWVHANPMILIWVRTDPCLQHLLVLQLQPPVVRLQHQVLLHQAIGLEVLQWVLQ